MSERVFRKIDDELKELTKEDYVNEDELQDLVAHKPSLIIPEDEDYKLLLIKREMGVPEKHEGGNRWSLDHLFVGSDEIPTLVEVKQSSDSRIHREVIGQMMDYAANGSIYWTIESLKNSLSERLQEEDKNYSDVIDNFIPENTNPTDFWKQVHSNLRSGIIRLVFVTDEIPVELKTTIEFLEEYLKGIETFGVQIKKHSLNTYTTVFTRRFEDLPKPRATNKKQWDKESFLHSIEENHGSEMGKKINELFDWNNENNLEEDFGCGKVDGSYCPYFQAEEDWYCPIKYWTLGRINIQFERLRSQIGFADKETRLDMLEKINAIPGVNIDKSRINGRPSFDMNILSDKTAYNKFIEFLEWFVAKVKSLEADSKE